MKIADVGIAKDEKEVTGTWAGTPVCMVPEIFSQSEIYGAPVDIYSLGLIMWELWYGERVFTEVTSITELMKKVENGHRPGHVEDCEPVLFQFGTLMQKCYGKLSQINDRRLPIALKLSAISSIIGNKTLRPLKAISMVEIEKKYIGTACLLSIFECCMTKPNLFLLDYYVAS